MPSAPNEQTPKRHAIVYYSRDGHTDRLAQQLAKSLDADLFRIVTGRYTGKGLGYLQACLDSLTGRLPKISPIADLSGYTSLSLGAPVWTSYPATPLRAYLATGPTLPKMLGVFTTSGGNATQDKPFSTVRNLLGQPVVATLNVPNALGESETRNRVSDYCEALMSASHTANSA